MCILLYILGGFLPLGEETSPGGLPRAALFTLSSHSAAKSKPIIAEPEIHGAQPLDGVTGFLVLMSEGLYKALEAAHGPGQANQVSPPPGRVPPGSPQCGMLPWGPSQPSCSLHSAQDPELRFSNALTRQLLCIRSWGKKMPSVPRIAIPPRSVLVLGLKQVQSPGPREVNFHGHIALECV